MKQQKNYPYTIDFSLCGICKEEVVRLAELSEKNEKVRINIKIDEGITHLEVLD